MTRARRSVRDYLPWAGILLAVIGWFGDFNVSYALTHAACASGQTWMLHAVSLGGIAFAAAGVGLSWWGMRGSPVLLTPRAHFVGLVGCLFTGLLLLVVIAQALPKFVLDPCEF